MFKALFSLSESFLQVVCTTYIMIEPQTLYWSRPRESANQSQQRSRPMLIQLRMSARREKTFNQSAIQRIL